MDGDNVVTNTGECEQRCYSGFVDSAAEKESAGQSRAMFLR